MPTLPKARSEQTVVQDFKDEVLVYDLKTNRALCLNATSAIVYRECDGRTTFSELFKRHGLTEDMINYALEQLREESLIENSRSFFAVPRGVSRRQALKKIGLASAVALPIISGVTAPMALHAASCAAGGAPCNLNNPAACCSQTCLVNNGNPICLGVCTANGNSCNLNNPGACCSGICLVNNGNPVCGAACTPAGGSCSLNNPGACCSQTCLVNNGNPICL